MSIRRFSHPDTMWACQWDGSLEAAQQIAVLMAGSEEFDVVLEGEGIGDLYLIWRGENHIEQGQIVAKGFWCCSQGANPTGRRVYFVETLDPLLVTGNWVDDVS